MDPSWVWEFHHPNWQTPSFFRGVGLNHQADDHQWMIILCKNPRRRIILCLFTCKTSSKNFFTTNRNSGFVMNLFMWFDLLVHLEQYQYGVISANQNRSISITPKSTIIIHYINIYQPFWSLSKYWNKHTIFKSRRKGTSSVPLRFQ